MDIEPDHIFWLILAAAFVPVVALRVVASIWGY